jgi:hypothetical protein
METGLSSNAMPLPPGFLIVLAAAASALAGQPLAAQDDSSATSTPPAATPPPAPRPPRINMMVTKPRNEPSEADLRECRADEEAAAINGEIVVCRVVGNDGTGLTGSRAETQKRYAQETAFKGAPPPPDMFGIPDNGKGIGFGKPPPVAITVDFDALPPAPAGSDADRMARGLPPLEKDGELSEEEERARREAAGIRTTVPPRTRKKGG